MRSIFRTTIKIQSLHVAQFGYSCKTFQFSSTASECRLRQGLRALRVPLWVVLDLVGKSLAEGANKGRAAVGADEGTARDDGSEKGTAADGSEEGTAADGSDIGSADDAADANDGADEGLKLARGDCATKRKISLIYVLMALMKSCRFGC